MRCDVAVIGGGFYGCCLASYLGAAGQRVVLLEKERDLLLRASAANQARVHAGFHYPRSLSTAIRSLANFPRFAFEFRKAITDDFTMLYAIARHGSKVTAKRFFHMFKAMGAPIEPARPAWRGLFSDSLIEGVFEVREYAFDCDVVREILRDGLARAGVEPRLGVRALRIGRGGGDGLRLATTGGDLEAGCVFNCTYSLINGLLDASGADLLPLKHELTEIALMEPPEALADLGVTVMDGPFFSTMPYPARRCWSMSHVRYTPRDSWRDLSPCVDGHKLLDAADTRSSFPLMQNDAARYLPAIKQGRYLGSLWEVKTVLLRNEIDDGRPIFLRRHAELGQVYTVLGSKIDNVYDLFQALGDIRREFRPAKSAWPRLLGL